MTEIQQWSDAAMFRAEPMRGDGISVHLLWMTPDPLGAIAAACRMYEGFPTYNLSDINDRDRMRYWRQVQATHLKAPLEFVKFHFFIEGVDRAFTHQMVRQRTAVYAQESMRFAVKDNMSEETPLPPSLMGLSEDDPKVSIWRNAIGDIQTAYDQLVNTGVPAEDARGLLPHATTTRLNYATDLRALADHAGNRLCTQAQFHWRIVFTQIRQAIRDYPLTQELIVEEWQFEELSRLFMPVCYQMGRCPFKAEFDRGCTIRDRVDAFHSVGLSSDHWDEGSEEHDIAPIDPAEWLANPNAAHVRKGDAHGDQSQRW